MDPRLFAPGAPGRLVRTATRKGPDTGFVPDPLPREWQMPAKTRALLERAHAGLAALRKAGEKWRARPLAASFLRLEEAIRSSVSARSAEVTARLVQLEPVREGRWRDPARAWRDAFRYRRVLERAQASLDCSSAVPVRALIQEIHAGLFEGRPRRGVFPGRLRRGFIQMGEGARYVPPPYAYVVPCLTALERWVARGSTIEPLVRCFMVKYQLMTIHPFADGNGRVGRILLAAMLNGWLMRAAPLLYLGPFLVANKAEYVDRQFRVNTHGDWAPWIEFCLHGTALAAARAIETLARLEEIAQRVAGAIGGEGAAALADELLATPAFTRPQLETYCARNGYSGGEVTARLRERGTAMRTDVNGFSCLVEPAKLLCRQPTTERL